MVLLSYALFPILLSITLHIQRTQNKYYKTKYFNSAVLALCGAFFLLLLNINKINIENFEFVKDYKFYIAQLIQITSIIIQIKVRKHNENNLTICYFVNFLTIALIPFVSIFLMFLFEFKDTLEVEYKSLYHVLGLSLSLVLLSILFYIDKFKSKSINKVNWLIAGLFFSSFSIVFTTKLMQEYNATNYMIISSIINLIVFFLLASFKEEIYNNEFRKSLFSNKSDYIRLSLFYCGSLSLNIFIISNLPVEYYSIMRSVGIIFVNYIYSYYYDNINLVNIKDLTILSIIIMVLLFFTLNF